MGIDSYGNGIVDFTSELPLAAIFVSHPSEGIQVKSIRIVSQKGDVGAHDEFDTIEGGA